MLSMHALKSASAAAEITKYLSESDTTEYYSEHDRAAAVWYGAGCKDFGLQAGGEVDLKDLENMLRGYAPNGEQFTRNLPEDDHRCGLDMTFSSPKSVSMLRAFADIAERAEIDHIILQARKDALDYATQRGAFVIRKGAGGRFVENARPVFAMFSHHSNREGDMQEHYHCIAVNAAKDDQGNGYRLEMSAAWRQKMELGAVMRTFEAAALQRAGYTIERDNSSYRVVAFSREAEKYFSKGSARINKAVGQAASAKMRAVAAMNERGEKIHEEPETADRNWRDEGLVNFGLTHRESVLQAKTQPQEVREAAQPNLDLTQIIDKLSERGPYFRDADLRQAIAVAAQGVHDGHAIALLAEQALSSHRLVPIYASQAEARPWMTQTSGAEALDEKQRQQAEQSYFTWTTDNPERGGRYSFASYIAYVQDKWRTANKARAVEAKKPNQLGWTTRETIHADQELARYAAEAAKSRRHTLDGELVDKILSDFEARKSQEIPGFRISDQQRGAIKHATEAGDLAQIHGVAGAGKSTFLDPVARAYETNRYKVIGLSFLNTNAIDLGTDVNIDSYTLDKFIGLTRGGPGRTSEERLEITDKTVIIVDEAGQVGGQKMHQVQRVVEAAGAKLILSGHEAQKQAISGTAALKLMREAAGEGGHYYLYETQRQTDREHGEALTRLSEGDATAALIKHAEKGRLHIVQGEGYGQAGAAYQAHVEKVGVDKAFVLTDTNVAMRRANNEIRDNLKAAGVVADEDFTVTLSDKKRNEYETKLAIGDRIITRDKVKSERAIQNGIVWRITDLEEIDPGRLKIGMKRADGKAIDKAGRKRVEIDTAEVKNFHLSYAMTTDLSQGKTRDAGAILITDASRAEITQWYVSTSRFRDVPDIIISEYAVTEAAAMQGRVIRDPLDPREGARVILDMAEDQSHKKTHTLDYKLDGTYQRDELIDRHLIAELEQRQRAEIHAGKAAEKIEFARINTERAARAKTEKLAGRGKSLATAASQDGRLAPLEQRKLPLASLAALGKTDRENPMVAALHQAKTATDVHAIRAAERAESRKLADARKRAERRMDASEKAFRRAISAPPAAQFIALHEARDEARGASWGLVEPRAAPHAKSLRQQRKGQALGL